MSIQRRLCVGIFCSVIVVWSCSGAKVYGDFSGQLPVSRAVALDPNGPLPEHVELIGAATGTPRAYGPADFAIYWEPITQRVRSLSPNRSIPICNTDDTPTAELYTQLAASAVGFLTDNAEAFGIDPSQIGDLQVRTQFDDYMVIARQKVDDAAGNPVYVNGANARVVIYSNGDLGPVKLFVDPDLPTVAPDFVDLQPARARITNELGYTILGEERRIVYPGAGDLASRTGMWNVHFRAPDGQEGHILAKADTAALVGEWRYINEFPLNGVLRAVSPTTDPGDANYLFTTARDVDPDVTYPVAGARVVSGVDITVTDETGAFTLESTQGIDARWIMEQALDPGQGFEPQCPDDEERDSLIVVPDPDEFGCSSVCTSPVFSRPVDPAGGEVVLPFEELSPIEQDGVALLGMAFHHASRFAHDYLTNIEHFGMRLDRARRFPLTVSAQPANDGAFYAPGVDRSTLCLPVMLDFGEDFGVQFTTPTIVYHEVSHHFIVDLTGIVSAAFSNCFLPVVNLCEDPILPEELFVDFTESATEAAADALAANYTDETRFGFTDVGTVPGALSYNIALPAERNVPRLESHHAVLANLLWAVRQGIAGAPVNQADENPRIDATRLLYYWVRSNVVAESTDISFTVSQELFSELQDARRALFGCLSNRTLIYEEVITEAFANAGGLLMPIRFRRGDANQDGTTDMTDAIHSLSYQFLGNLAVFCDEALDVNDNDKIDISDPLILLQHLFLGTPAPPPPFEECGFDNTGEGADTLTCEGFGRGGCDIAVPCVQR